MQKLSLFAILILSGCATVQVYDRPGMSVANYNPIAISDFQCADKSLGIYIADRIAMGFSNEGYEMVDRAQIVSVIEENALSMSGITQEEAKSIKLLGAQAVMVGSVYAPACVQIESTNEGKISKSTQCTASISIKVMDISNGLTIWRASASKSLTSSDMTQIKITEQMTEEILETVPKSINKITRGFIQKK